MSFIYKGRNIKSVGFIGFGNSNRGVYDYLLRKYPELEFTVRSACEPLVAPKNCRFLIGKNEFSALNEDLIFLSPTVKRNRRELLGFEENGRITSDARFFYDNTKSVCYSVTGSDGKSTTSAMTAAILNASGISAFAIGNIGAALTPALDQPNQRFVTELSSFQLMDLKPRARRSAILNVSPNHLDWHSSYDEYKSAKENAILFSDDAVLSLDSKELLPIAKRRRCFALFSVRLSLSEMLQYPAEVYYHLDGGFISRSGERLLEIAELKRQEEHYIKNFLAALSLTDGDARLSAIKQAARDFCPLPHRCELVFTRGGVDYYDSSIDSSPERTKTTLKSFPHDHVLVLGGRSKGLGYESLASMLGEHTKAIVINGENRFEIETALSGATLPIYETEKFADAVRLAARLARGVGAVLLSPASTSYDQFSNFEERGAEFLRIVRTI